MIKTIKLETTGIRLYLIIAGFVLLISFLFFAKWCFANAIALRAPAIEVAELAIAMAPNDPQTHYASAVLHEKTFLAGDLPESLAEFERATSLAPNDYRLWLAFGKALERDGNTAGAELALRRAQTLAPHYAQVRWTLGNILLRRGKTEEAFDEIRRAAESNADFRMPTITTAWQIFDGNMADIKRFIGDSSNLSAELALFLAEQKQFEQAIAVWQILPSAEKKTIYKTAGEQLFGKLIAAKKYHYALAVQQDFQDRAEAERIAIGNIYNGGFETDIERGQLNIFDWQISDGAQPQIGPNTEDKHGGNRSIFIIYNSTDGKDFRSFSQLIAVEPAKKYVFGGFYKSNLKTAATLLWEISDATDGKILAASKPIAANAVWTDFKMEFVVPENTEGVMLRLAREPCKSIVCPITGYVWFDDFSFSQ